MNKQNGVTTDKPPLGDALIASKDRDNTPQMEPR